MAATPACSTMAGEACCLTPTTPSTLCTRLSPHHERHRPLLHLPSRPTSISLRKILPLGPLVARTSDWVPQQGEKEVNVVVEEEDGWEKGYEEWLKGPESMVEGVEEEEEEGVVEEGGGFEAGVSEDVEEASYPEPPEEAKLFVGNLPYDIDSESLAKLFEEAGVVEIAEVIYNRKTDQSRGFGFITMSTIKEADKAIEMFHRYDCNGRLLTVNRVAPRGSQPGRPPRRFEPSSFRVYVGNLPWLVDATRLEQVFSEHGKVVDARVVYDRETGRSRGFGFVTMSTQEEVDDAIAALNGQGLDGRAIRVNIAEDRPRRGSFQFRQTDPY